MKPLSEHETVIRVLREMVEQVIMEASPAMATVTGVGGSGEVYVRLDDEEAARAASVPRNPAMRLYAGDRVLVVRTLANQLVIACPVASTAAGTQAARIGTEQLVEQAVTTEKLAPFAVTAERIGTSAVTEEKLARASVTLEKLASSALTAGPTGPAGPQGVPGPQGAPGGQGPQGQPGSDANLGDGSVKTRHIAGGAVTSEKIEAGAVVGGKIADGAVNRDKVAKRNDGQPIFADRGHDHELSWGQVGAVTFRQTQNGNPTNLSLEQALNRLYKKAFGADSSVP